MLVASIPIASATLGYMVLLLILWMLFDPDYDRKARSLFARTKDALGRVRLRSPLVLA
jgi:hypothetical protein